ncbi:hypothetical protein CDAR_420471 [Caerostris darwini]|uniref:Uncharacterized protein n=1 Tax=Caerostris darwini TaxID=1538125 RepID=A0AAV4TWI0_9ARAC|nr:hypothetical protein CDAR_420471 [Caerostris darwini]
MIQNTNFQTFLSNTEKVEQHKTPSRLFTELDLTLNSTIESHQSTKEKVQKSVKIWPTSPPFQKEDGNCRSVAMEMNSNKQSSRYHLKPRFAQTTNHH